MGSRFYTTFWSFDPATGTWTQQASGPALHSHGMVAKDGRLYVFGQGRLWQYTIATDTWEELVFGGPWPQARIGFTFIRVGDRIFLFGGLSYQSSTLSELWELE